MLSFLSSCRRAIFSQDLPFSIVVFLVLKAMNFLCKIEATIEKQLTRLDHSWKVVLIARGISVCLCGEKLALIIVFLRVTNSCPLGFHDRISELSLMWFKVEFRFREEVMA